MGKGDRRSKRGKIFRGTFGKAAPRTRRPKDAKAEQLTAGYSPSGTANYEKISVQSLTGSCRSGWPGSGRSIIIGLPRAADRFPLVAPAGRPIIYTVDEARVAVDQTAREGVLLSWRN